VIDHLNLTTWANHYGWPIKKSFPSTGDIAGHCKYGHIYQPTAVLPYSTLTSSKIYWTDHFTAAPGYAVRTLLGGINEHSSCPMFYIFRVGKRWQPWMVHNIPPIYCVICHIGTCSFDELWICATIAEISYCTFERCLVSLEIQTCWNSPEMAEKLGNQKPQKWSITSN